MMAKCRVCKEETEVVFNIGFKATPICKKCATAIFIQQATWYTQQGPIQRVSNLSPSEEEIREPIQNALYSTGSFTSDQCTDLADGILAYLEEWGFKVVRG